MDIIAKVVYGSNKLTILNEGWVVYCAVTGKQIFIDDLRYWNVERQEPYIDAAAMWKRELETRDDTSST